MKAFARHGFDGVSLRTIADEAGVNHQLITHHFGSKQDLWDAALDSHVELFRAFHDKLDAIDEMSDPREKFRSYVHTLVERMVAHPEITCIYYHEGLANRESAKSSDRYQRILDKQIGQYRAMNERLLAQAQKAGVIEQMPIDDLWFVFQGAIFHRVIMAKESEHFTGVPIEEVVEAHTDAIVKIFTKRD